MSSPLRLLLLVVAGAVLLSVAGPALRERAVEARDGRLTTTDGDTIHVTDDARDGHLRFAPTVAPADQQWVLAAVARARPEAVRLIAEVDGLVVIAPLAGTGGMLGLARGHERGFAVELDFAALNGDAAADRATVVLHELGHVIDFALVPRSLNERLDAAIPRGGPCGEVVDCDRREERFADTFAKWALNGAVSEIGAGYGIAMPASIEDWGAPLRELSLALPAA